MDAHQLRAPGLVRLHPGLLLGEGRIATCHLNKSIQGHTGGFVEQRLGDAVSISHVKGRGVLINLLEHASNAESEDLPVVRHNRADTFLYKGIVVDESVTFRQLLGYLKVFFSKLGYPNARFRPGFFPYTEPSVQIDIWVPERNAWMELGGSGVCRPEVVEPLLGIDIPVLAWGPGMERQVMERNNITDIRKMYDNDLNVLRKTPLWRSKED